MYTKLKLHLEFEVSAANQNQGVNSRLVHN